MNGPEDIPRSDGSGRSRPSRVRRTRHSWHPWLPTDAEQAAEQSHFSPHQPHGGNELVNERPGERPGEQNLGSGLGPDEAELRRLLHQAVDVLEPRDKTLEYLRQAVPARRARKRQALVGVAAAALFAGTAVPTALHVSSAGSAEDVRAGSVAGSTEVQGGQGDDLDTGAGGGFGKELPGLPGVTEDADDRGKGSKGGDGASADATAPAGAPACSAGQLTISGTEVGQFGQDGSVSGLFRVSNAAIAGCVVSDPGTVSVTAQGAADPARIGVVRQAGGVDRLLLGPGDSYEIRFTWVPSGSCPTDPDPVDPTTSGGGDGGTPTSGGGDGGTTTPPATEGTTAGEKGSGATGTEGAEDGMAPQLGTAQISADGSVAVTYRPEGADGAGTPATVDLAGACAGTVHRTGILAGG
jgi:hypothetical protein